MNFSEVLVNIAQQISTTTQCKSVRHLYKEQYDTKSFQTLCVIEMKRTCRDEEF